MRFSELPIKFQRQALQLAIDGCNELFRNEGINVTATESTPEVLQYVEEREYEIERGSYEKGMPFERLVMKGCY